VKDIMERAESVKEVASDEVDFLSDSALAILHEEAKSPRWIINLSAGFILLVILWASITEVDEIVRAQGTAVPSGSLQLVQSLEGGQLEELFVSEGQTVREGQLLLTIDDSDVAALLIRTETEYLAALARIARLRGEIDGSDPIYPERVVNDSPELITEENRTLELRREARATETRIARLDQADLEQEAQSLVTQIASLEEQRDYVQEERDITAPLVERGAVAAIDLIRIDQNLSELNARISESTSRRTRVLTQIERAAETVDQIGENFIARAQEELASLIVAVQISEAGFTSEDARAQRLQVRSPTNGVVKRILVTTIGEVIQPGEDIVEVLPIDEELVFEAKVSPKDIGFIRNDLSASIKVSAYEFATYGGLDAVVEQIGVDTVIDEDTHETYYLVTLRVSNNLIDANGNPLPILPGMEASIDIKTDTKSVLQYFFKPLLRMIKS